MYFPYKTFHVSKETNVLKCSMLLVREQAAVHERRNK